MTAATPYPHNQEVERALLGSLLQEPDRIRDLVGLGLLAGDFYAPKHGHLYQHLVERWRKGDPIDITLVCTWVARQKDPGLYGGVGYVSELPDYAPSSVNVAFYGREVVEAAARRQVLDLSHKLRKGVQEGADLDDLVGAATDLGRTLRAYGHHRPQTMASSVQGHLDRIEAIQNGSRSPVVPTGFRDLDEMLAGGLRGNQLVVLGARPGMGKTALLMNLLTRVADPQRRGVPVGFCSLEMDEEQTLNRHFTAWTRINFDIIRDYERWNEKPHDDRTVWDHVLEVNDDIKALRIHTDYASGRTVEKVWEQAKRWVADHGIRVLGVDYLQLMKATDRRVSREQQVAHMSRGLKAVAKELDICVIALAQLNRGLEQRQNKRPIVPDIRESGAIEQDADAIWFLYRHHKYHRTASPRDAELIIAKQRQGREGTVRLHWFGEFQLFQDVPRRGETAAS